jgi:general secretion pathway protein H
VRSERGFTLIEIMVVVSIIAVLMAVAYLGFNQLLGRQFQRDAETLQAWLEDLNDRAILQGAVYGIEVAEEGVEPLVYRQGYWLRLPDFSGWSAAQGYRLQLEVTGSTISAARNSQEDGIQPQLIVMPDGSLLPQGSITLSGEIGESAAINWTKSGNMTLEIL